MIRQVALDGHALAPGFLGPAECARMIIALGPVAGAGRRGLLGCPEVARLARSSALLDLVRPHLPEPPIPVRALYFDKSPEANWLVPWHQDLTLALRDRVDAPGFGPWSVKAGIPHVRPPDALLGRMLAVRIHLDDADEANGALKVIPGSHRLGRLSPSQILEHRSATPERACPAKIGDAHLMRPLLLHASGRSASPRHRRVLHLEFAGFSLPPGLAWHESA